MQSGLFNILNSLQSLLGVPGSCISNPYHPGQILTYVHKIDLSISPIVYKFKGTCLQQLEINFFHFISRKPSTFRALSTTDVALRIVEVERNTITIALWRRLVFLDIKPKQRDRAAWDFSTVFYQNGLVFLDMKSEQRDRAAWYSNG
uniref:Uncharacterized protein n=1 Tax=Glossina palpalis gambiensis TaxID=67801 RepID=A0A1B0BKS1_9MUSC